MERGVVVGGLMICGSFLLAALLNHSAMEEMPESATAAGCATVEERADSRRSAVQAESSRATTDLAATSAGDLRVVSTNDLKVTVTNDLTATTTNDLTVNGREACPP